MAWCPLLSELHSPFACIYFDPSLVPSPSALTHRIVLFQVRSLLWLAYDGSKFGRRPYRWQRWCLAVSARYPYDWITCEQHSIGTARHGSVMHFCTTTASCSNLGLLLFETDGLSPYRGNKLNIFHARLSLVLKYKLKATLWILNYISCSSSFSRETYLLLCI